MLLICGESRAALPMYPAARYFWVHGERINALNEGLRTFKEELNRDSLANKRVEVAIVTFNTDVQVVQDFVTADQFEPPMLVAQGLTHTGSAIHEALDMIEAQKSSIAITEYHIIAVGVSNY